MYLLLHLYLSIYFSFFYCKKQIHIYIKLQKAANVDAKFATIAIASVTFASDIFNKLAILAGFVVAKNLTSRTKIIVNALLKNCSNI